MKIRSFFAMLAVMVAIVSTTTPAKADYIGQCLDGITVYVLLGHPHGLMGSGV